MLFLPAEKDELTQGAAGAIEAAKFLSGRGVPSQAIVLPGLTHFQAYSNAGFEIGSNLAADWFLKYLASAAKRRRRSRQVCRRSARRPVDRCRRTAACRRDTRETSRSSAKACKSHGKLFLPAGFSATSNAAAVIVAPNAGRNGSQR